MPVVLNQTKSDYPFGMVMPGRSFTAASVDGYGFGYQGSLKIDGSSSAAYNYSTFYRELDPRLGKWWSIDPQIRQSPWESPYMSMGSNPILRNDQLGDRWFDRNTKQLARQTKQDFRQIKNNPNSSMEQRREMSLAISELKAMRKHEQEFRITVETFAPAGGFTAMTIVGGINVIDIVVPAAGITVTSPNGYELRTMAHELKHGFQYIRGRISYSGTTTFGDFLNGTAVVRRPVGLLYDVEDEDEAFTRGFAVQPGWTGWSFTSKNSINDQRLSTAPSYANLSMDQRYSRSNMGRIDVLRQRQGLAAIGLTGSQRLMDYEKYQGTMAAPEIFVPQSKWTK
mgnify:CR=1 FL=1